jgi:hypothetical protein
MNPPLLPGVNPGPAARTVHLLVRRKPGTTTGNMGAFNHSFATACKAPARPVVTQDQGGYGRPKRTERSGDDRSEPG